MAAIIFALIESGDKYANPTQLKQYHGVALNNYAAEGMEHCSVSVQQTHEL